MNRTDFRDLPNQSDFDALSELIFARVKDYVGQDALAKEITSEVQIKLVKEDISEIDREAWIHKQVESIAESYISDLWSYCFHYALKLTEDPDLAQDTTQTVMVALLQSKQEVLHVKGWLKQAVYNQCILATKDEKKKRELGKKLASEAPMGVAAQAVDEEQLEKGMSDADLKRLLSKEDYAELREMRKYKTLKDYAQAKGMNSSAARKRKHCILTNLKAGYLNEQGWVNVPEILDYRTMVNIKRFLNTLVEKNRLGDYKQLYHYCTPEIAPKLQATLKGISNILDWGISQISPKHYQVSFVASTNRDNPSLVVVEITINRANYIRITECYGSMLAGMISESKLGQFPSEKGKYLLTREDIYNYTH